MKKVINFVSCLLFYSKLSLITYWLCIYNHFICFQWHKIVFLSWVNCWLFVPFSHEHHKIGLDRKYFHLFHGSRRLRHKTQATTFFTLFSNRDKVKHWGIMRCKLWRKFVAFHLFRKILFYQLPIFTCQNRRKNSRHR